MQQAAVVNLDETGWRQAQQRAWLWTVVTGTLTVFRIGHSQQGLNLVEFLVAAGEAALQATAAPSLLPAGQER